MADILRQLYYGRDIIAGILRQIYYGRYITADTLRQICCVPPQRRPYLDKFPATEALDCCIRICLLQRIAPRTPLDCFMLYTSRTDPFLVGHRAKPGETQGFRRGWTPMGGRSLPIGPPGQAPLYILDIYIYIYIYIYI